MSERCVACNEVMENPQNHHCDPKREAAIERARKAYEATCRPRTPSEAERLYLGLEMTYGWEEDNEE
jgi:hypothetical protein